MSEDCLRLNVWTPAIRPGIRRPVLFWLHEGGFYRGSSLELRTCQGTNLARSGDVVVVSINHRLGDLGFLNLAQYGSRYEATANLGMLDIVAALEWVRDNVAQFGGDPDNVTIFGQSGGASKVNYLMAMPLAKGLFHKAIVQSAVVPVPSYTFERAAKYATELIAAVGLTRATADQICTIPFERLAQASVQVMKSDRDRQYSTMPVPDGRLIPLVPFDAKAPEISANVPLLIGNTDRESGPILGPEPYRLTEAELRTRLVQKFGSRADEVLTVFHKTFPEDKPYDLWTRIDTIRFRNVSVRQATMKAAQRAAPVWLYMFGWKTPVFDGLPHAFHGSELAFVFNNTDLCSRLTGGTEAARTLAARVSRAWVQFARSGNPNHAAIPAWPSFREGKEPTMFFDNKCSVRYNYDSAARRVLELS